METEIKKLQERITKLEQQRDTLHGQLYTLTGSIGALVAVSNEPEMLGKTWSAMDSRLNQDDERPRVITNDRHHQGIGVAFDQVKLAMQHFQRP